MSPGGPHPSRCDAAGVSELRSVLVVCAHPDDESFGLGGVLWNLGRTGASLSILSFTRGEASTLGGPVGDLARVRQAELAAAADVLGVGRVRLLDYQDGALSDVDPGSLADEVVRFAASARPDGLLVFDRGGITGHPDHRRATRAALLASEALGLPVLAWALPHGVARTLNQEFGTAFTGRSPGEVDLVVDVDRDVQRRAIACHRSQATTNPLLWRRLELQGRTEWLRWLRQD